MVEGFQSRSAEAKLDKLVLGAAVQELEKTKTYKNIFPPVSWIVDSPSSGGSPQKPPKSGNGRPMSHESAHPLRSTFLAHP